MTMTPTQAVQAFLDALARRDVDAAMGARLAWSAARACPVDLRGSVV